MFFSSSDLATPEEVEKIYKDLFKNMPLNSQHNLTSLSHKSKNSNPNKEIFKDWALTPLYEEYQKQGKRIYRDFDETRYYSQNEAKRVYEFVKSRYNSKEHNKFVISFC